MVVGKTGTNLFNDIDFVNFYVEVRFFSAPVIYECETLHTNCP